MRIVGGDVVRETAAERGGSADPAGAVAVAAPVAAPKVAPAGAGPHLAPTLKAQLSATILEIQRMETRVARLKATDTALYDRFHRVIEPDLAERRDELQALAAEHGAPSPTTWAKYAETKARCDELLSEAHDFIQGALVRQATLDDGLCAVADRLLDGLSERCHIPWDRLSVPADSEFVSDLAQIVRIRAGDVSVWHLPVAAHEFGHFIGPRIEVKGAHPFAELLAARRVGSMAWSHAHELFADAFAVYAIGPSFLAACVISRFHPGQATEVSETHPSHARRVALMSQVLGAIDRDIPDHPYTMLLAYLDATWRANLAAAGQPTELDPFDMDPVTEAAETYLAILRDGVPDARYAGMNDARKAEKAVMGKQANPPPAVSIADVLNGAWLSRIDQPIVDVPSLEQRGKVALRWAKEAVRA
jgi:hypothetical protein